jgi:hypothetical protein
VSRLAYPVQRPKTLIPIELATADEAEAERFDRTKRVAHPLGRVRLGETAR